MIQGAELQDLGLGEDEERTYEALLRQRAAKPEELARVLGIPRERLNAALTRLSDHGFTTPGDATSALPHPAAPAAAIRTLIHRRQAELHLRSAELERLMMSADRIAGRLMEGSPSASEGGIEVVTGTRAVGERAESLLASAEQEVMVLDRPPYAKGPEEADSSRSPGLDIKALLDRGIEVRTVIDREGLSYPGRMRSLNTLISHGLRARVTTGVPTKLIIVDRRITLLPRPRPRIPQPRPWSSATPCSAMPWSPSSKRSGTRQPRSAAPTPPFPKLRRNSSACSPQDSRTKQ